VSVHAERVHVLGAVHHVAELRADERRARVGGVHVDPDAVRRRDGAQLPDRVDGGRLSGPDRRAQEERDTPGVHVGLHGGLESGWREREHAFKARRDLAAVVAVDAGDARGLADREVGLVGAVDDEVVDPPAADLRELPLPRGDECAEDGLARGAQERAPATAAEQQAPGQVQRLAEPVHDHHLELGGGRRGGPRERHDVDAGGEGLAEGADGAARRREVREVSRALPVRHAGQDEVVDVPQRRGERVGLGARRRVRGELPAEEAGRHVGVHGVVFHAGVVVRDEVDDLVALPPELFGIKQTGAQQWRRQHRLRFRRDDGRGAVEVDAIIVAVDVALRRRRHACMCIKLRPN